MQRRFYISIARACLPGLFFLGTLNAVAQVDIQIRPSSVLVGETASIILTPEHGTLQLTELPTVAHLVWLTKSPIRDGNRRILNFRVSRPGILRLPDFKLLYNERPLSITPPAIDVQAPDIPPEAIRLELSWNQRPLPPARVFANQAIQLVITLEVVEGLHYEVHDALFERHLMPTVAIPNGVFREFPGQNEYSKRFHFRSSRRREDGKMVRSYSYRCVFWLPHEGELNGRLAHEVPLVLIRPGTENDFMTQWHPPPQRVVWWPVEGILPAIPVQPLPEPPEDTRAVMTGLVGDFSLSLAMDRASVRVGEGITMELAVSGSGNVEALRAPELLLPGFKVYPPQRSISGMNGTGQLRWLLVPDAVTSQLPELSFQYFSESTATWQASHFRPRLQVLPGGLEMMDPGFVGMLRPINTIGPVMGYRWLLIGWLLGPLFFLVVWCRHRRQATRRRLRWRRELAELVKTVQGSRNLPETVSDQVLPFMRRHIGLPPGATPEDIAARIRDPELAELLLAMGNERFRQRKEQVNDAAPLVQSLQRYVGCLLLMLLPIVGIASPNSKGPVSTAHRYYEENRYPEAAAELLPRWQDSGGQDANIAFNLGNCAYMARDYADAVLWYERARRLAPRDAQIRQNLQLARLRSGLPPATGSIIDRFRPEEWLALTAACWSLAWIVIALGLGRRQRGLGWLLLLALLGAGGVLCRHYQLRGSYHPNLALVTEEVILHRLPDIPMSTPLAVAPDTSVRVLEHQQGWWRIQTPQGQGWVPMANSPLLNRLHMQNGSF